MKINKNLVIELLQNELVYERTEHRTTLAELEMETKIRGAFEENANRIIVEKHLSQQEKAKLEKQIFEINTDFFDLGDMLMAAINVNGEKQPAQKMEDVVTGLDDFLQKQYEDRIDHLEALIFELGDDLDEEKAASKKAITEMKREAYDRGMVMVKQELENKELKIELVKLKEEAFEEDRKQITEEIEKAETEPLVAKNKSTITGDHSGCKNENKQPTTKVESVTARELMKKYAGNQHEKNIMLDIKNKLCNKGYEVQDTGKSLLAKKPGNCHIEVKPAELPGSFKYIICGQTCYEFDQAIKASTYGAKAIAPKLDAEAIS